MTRLVISLWLSTRMPDQSNPCTVFQMNDDGDNSATPLRATGLWEETGARKVATLGRCTRQNWL